MRFCLLHSKNIFVLVLTHLEPELELFEVNDNGNDGDDDLSHHYQTALARVPDELERNQKKENRLHTISKMMGTLVLVQLCTFSYRNSDVKKLPKIFDWR